MLNADKLDRWDDDVVASVDLYNRWFLKFAPEAFRSTRAKTAEMVKEAIEVSEDLAGLTGDVLKTHPHILPTLRMCCCPPIARDRLIGLAGVSDNLVNSLEGGKLPARMSGGELDTNLRKVVAVIKTMLDEDLFPWLTPARAAQDAERTRAATVIADRLCGSLTNPIIRNAQEERQRKEIRDYFTAKGYTEERPTSLAAMKPGTFWFGYNVSVRTAGQPVTITVNALVQPRKVRRGKLPVMIECKSAGDFANVNKRRKEESQKGRQFRAEFGSRLTYLLFLCGYFGKAYLQYVADEDFDWVWEHRIADFDQLGL